MSFDYNAPRSPSTRRAWIEIASPSVYIIAPMVALHPEGVDRNYLPHNLTVSYHLSRPPPGGRG